MKISKMTINFCNAKKNYLMCLLFFFGAPLLAFSEVIEKRNLETLDDNLKQSSLVLALSADGKIAGGCDNNGSGLFNTVIWSGDKWGTKTVLRTLENKSFGFFQYVHYLLMEK
ncbi:hypothetical protein [Candidatus Regiella insecticola]|nr:hypothetical protein [Candidatus Regiella insecticola]